MSPPLARQSVSTEIITDGRNTLKLSLTRRVRSGLGWNTSSTLIAQIIGFARSIIIARLLAPEDVGLFGMALAVHLGLNALTTLGLDHTILARQFESDDEFRAQLNTVWSTELLRSLLLALLVLASAYPMSRFFNQPTLVKLIMVLALVAAVEGFQNIGLTILRKQISFVRLFWFDLLVSAGSTVLIIVIAFATRSVWTLILGQLIAAMFGTSLSYFFHPYRPRFVFEKVAFRRILTFSKFAVVIAVSSYVTTMVDNVVVGRLLGTGALGNYALAYGLASFPIGVMIFALGRVTLPAFAELSASYPDRIEHAFTQLFSISSLGLVTIAVPLFLLADELVLLLFGEKWISAAPVLRVLSLIIPLRGLTLVVGSLFFGLNRPKPVATGKALEAVVFLLLILPLTKAFGLTGAAWAGVITYAFALANRFYMAGGLIPGLPAKLVRVSLATLGASAVGLLAAALILRFLESLIPRLFFGGLLAATIPALLLLLTRSDLRKWIVEAAT